MCLFQNPHIVHIYGISVLPPRYRTMQYSNMQYNTYVLYPRCISLQEHFVFLCLFLSFLRFASLLCFVCVCICNGNGNGSVCILLEICEYGSLSDILRGDVGGGVVKQPLHLTRTDRTWLALGCAR
jgi:hypothetical protein